MPPLVPITFTSQGKYGDFAWMIQDEFYGRGLFIFNDNEEQFLAFHRGDRDYGCRPGGGNAAVRGAQCWAHPRSAGIPTGSAGGGYRDLADAKPVIDLALNHVCDLLRSFHYDYIFYSAASDGHSLGSSIYNPSDEVKVYIVGSLNNIIRTF